MSNSDLPVFIVESPGPNDMVSGRSEAELLQQSLRLIGVPVVVFQARCKTELDVAIGAFRQLAPRLLHISAHGDSSGSAILLTDGTTIGWEDFLEPIAFTKPASYLFASACNSLAHGYLVRAALTHCQPNLRAVIGFETAVSWSQSALTSTLLYQSLHQDSQKDIHAAMLASYIALSVDLVAYFGAANGCLARLSGSTLLDQFVCSLIARDRTVFEHLVSSRGLLDTTSWTKWWDDQAVLAKELAAAMAATDAIPSLAARLNRRD